MNIEVIGGKARFGWLVMILVGVILAVYVYIFSKSMNCLNSNRGFAIGEISKIRGRENHDIEYAEYQFLVNTDSARCSGSSIIISKDLPTGSRKKVEVGDRFLVIFCKEKILFERCNSSTMLFQVPILDSIKSIDELNIELNDIKVSLRNL